MPSLPHPGPRAVIRAITAIVAASAILAGVVAISGGQDTGTVLQGGSDTSAQQSPGTLFDQAIALGGSDAAGAAIAWSQATFDTAPSVLLARDDDFPDALASGALQGDRPLLLTAPDRLLDAVAAELGRLGAGTVTVLGETNAIGPGVIDQLTARGIAVERIGGADRYATAASMASVLLRDAGTDGPVDVLIGRGDTTGTDPTAAWADSLSAGAHAASAGVPILLSPRDVLHPTTAAWLADNDVASVTLVGGEQALGPAVAAAVSDLDIPVSRVAGPTRADTAVAVAVELWGAAGSEDAPRTILADAGSPIGWAAGFTAAANAARHGAPVVLAVGPDLPRATATWAAGGGPLAVCAPLVRPAVCRDLHSPEPVELVVSVVDADGRPVAGALVEVVAADGTVVTGTTDADGLVVLVLPVGIYEEVRASGTDRAPGQVAGPIRVGAAGVSQATVVLDPAQPAPGGPDPDGPDPDDPEPDGSDPEIPPPGGPSADGGAETRQVLLDGGTVTMFPLADNDGLAPGYDRTREVAITNVDLRSRVRLTATVDGPLADFLEVEVTAIPPGGAGSVLFLGTLADLGDDHATFSTGLDDWLAGETGDQRTYRVRVTLPDDVGNEAQGLTASAVLVWEARAR